MLAEHVRLLIVNLDQQCALCRLVGGWNEWDLPYYTCDSIEPNSFRAYVSSLHEALGLDEKKPFFTGITDLLGDYPAHERGHGRSRPGYARLLLLETHDYSFQLPEGWAWKHKDFLENFQESTLCSDCGLEASMRLAVLLLNKSDEVMHLLWQPRHQFGWHGRASSWLRQIVTEKGANLTGPVVQHSVNAWTTILRVESCQGAFFLKSPTAGTPEIEITRALYKVLPEMTLDVVEVSAELASFVSREFEVVDSSEHGRHGLLSMMTRNIGLFQLASIEHKDTLTEAGCPVLEPCDMHHVLENMQNDEDMQRFAAGFLMDAEECAPEIESMLSRLVAGCYKIPLTVTHGDAALRNIGFKRDETDSKRMILFDWQYTVISHPFFDFHELKKKLNEQQIEEYLDMWTEYETPERCREAFELAYPLGWLIKVYTSLKCLRASRPEKIPLMITYVMEYWYRLRATVRKSRFCKTT